MALCCSSRVGEGDEAPAAITGRRAEFAKFPEFEDPEQRERIPDPTAEQTFLSAKLHWDEARLGKHAEWRDWYRRVLAVRHAEIIPRLGDFGGNSGSYEVLDDLAMQVRWSLADGLELVLTTNLKPSPLPGIDLPQGRSLWLEGSAGSGALGPWSVVWTLSGGIS